MSKELRTFTNCEVRAQQEEGKPASISGYGAVFNSRSNDLGGFVEIIKPGAFDGVLQDDVRALFNHDPMYVLGRNLRTMSLSIDDTGLRYDIPEAPNTQTIRDLVIEPMCRGDVTQSSFAFRVAKNGDTWYEDDEGVIVREIHKIERLYDVSPVTYPAYEAATSTTRSLDEIKKKGENNHELTEQRKAETAKWRAQVDRFIETL
jgi:HK97 family phage prohead protease